MRGNGKQRRHLTNDKLYWILAEVSAGEGEMGIAEIYYELAIKAKPGDERIQDAYREFREG